jgi:hypothetical protein
MPGLIKLEMRVSYSYLMAAARTILTGRLFHIGEDFDDLVGRYVKSRYLTDDLEENRKKVGRRLIELAKESTRFPEKLRREMDWLVTSESENGHSFGRTLGELDKDYYWLDGILQATGESEEPSVYFLGGYLSSVRSRDSDLWEKTLDECYEDDALRKVLLEILWLSESSDKCGIDHQNAEETRNQS